MRRQKKQDTAPKPGAPLWFITFSDMVTLLLGFFIAIVSFSNIEIGRYRAAMGSFRGALSSPFSSEQIPSGPLVPGLSESMQMAQEAVESAAEIKKLMQQLETQAGTEVEITPEGVKISLSNPILFDAGSDAMKPEAMKFLQGLSGIIRKHDPAGVLIEGHTDDTPIKTVRFPSNWELSSSRALAVLRLFQSMGVPAEKLAAIGYGEYRPKVKLPGNATSAMKGVNRRVEILLQLKADQPITGISSEEISPQGER